MRIERRCLSLETIEIGVFGDVDDEVHAVRQSTEAELSQPRWKNPTKLSYVSLEFVVQTSADDVALVVGFKLVPICIYQIHAAKVLLGQGVKQVLGFD